ncbi:MAG: SDR family NAD(P)-dependent oxidoreductase [Luteimonas sp.]
MAVDLELAGKRVLVTGGTRGIGAATVALFRAQRARVLTTARSPSSDTDREALVIADLGTEAGFERVAAAVHDRLGGVDIVVHVVGGSSAPVAMQRSPMSRGMTNCSATCFPPCAWIACSCPVCWRTAPAW